MAQPSVHGRFIWEGLMAEDAAKSTAFYSRLLGWRAEPFGADSAYTIFNAGRGPVAGASALTPELRSRGVPAHWMSYIGADDVDGSLAAAEKLGGKVQHPATDIPQVGRFGIVTDPQGGSFAIFKPLPAEGPPRAGEPQAGEIVWHELMTSDPEAALKFYQALFGWQLITKMDMGAIGFYWVFGNNGVQMGGMFKSPMPGVAWLAYTSVADADKTAAAITQAGGRVCNGPMDVPGGGRIAQLADPSGVMFAVHSMKKAAAAPPAASTPPAPKPAPKPAAPKPAVAKPAAPAAPAATATATAPKPAAPKPVPKPAAPAPAPSAAPKPAAAAPPKPAAAPAATAGSAPAKAAPKPAAAKKKAAPKKKAAAKKKSAPKKKAAPKKKRAAARKKAASRKKTAAARKSAAKRSPAARKVAKPAKRKKDKKKKDKKSKKDRKREKKNKKGRRKK